MEQYIPITKGNEEVSVPSDWRATLSLIVDAFVMKNYELLGIRGVEPLSNEHAAAIGRTIAAYGSSLGRLSESTWNSSVSRWMGSHWQVLVDLNDSAGEQTDLVLFVKIIDHPGQYRFLVDSVHVP